MDSKNNEVKISKRNRRPAGRKATPLDVVWTFLQVIIGSFVVALSFNLFLAPNGIASGGVSGISILVHKTLGITPAYTQWALNIPLFLAGLLLLGKRFALKTLLGTIVLPLFVLLTADWSPPTDNMLLAAIYGGIGVGIGLGIVFRGRGSTGGLDLAAQILHRYTGIPLGLAVACFDGCVIAASGILISPEAALYALIGLFVTSKTIDIIQSGIPLSKVAFIISDQADLLVNAILHDLDRGVTRLDAHGGYTNEKRQVLMAVVGQMEVAKLKQLVRAVDPGAFVIISNTAEVVGQGFKSE
ncbi:YitT family protein [Paenibacillus sp. ATY16]|uniref:YitT family protein n=1 Tax=Paenibacillus sp. ATY16 TaxID=1759312 RepID=UPI000E2E73DA|nr:YitT family protein [Paenibacillus sp. ATY16]MCK9858064.1 YitT family protein [Paenibacillus sp. ATY16]